MAIDKLIEEIKTIIFKKTKAMNYKLLKRDPLWTSLYYNFRIGDLILSIGSLCDGLETICVWKKKDLLMNYSSVEGIQGKITSYSPGEWEEIIHNYYSNLKGEKPILFDGIQRKYQDRFLKKRKKLIATNHIETEEAENNLPF